MDCWIFSDFHSVNLKNAKFLFSTNPLSSDLFKNTLFTKPSLLLFNNIHNEKLNYFESKAKQLLINQLPINITSIIYVDDEESKYIAVKIQEYYKTDHQKNIEIVHFRNLKLQAKLTSPSCYLVCSSCISNGKKIAEVSRKLRSQENSQIIYFNGFVIYFFSLR